MRRYRYAGIPTNVAVSQVHGEAFVYDPDKGTYLTTVRHPELEQYYVGTEEEPRPTPTPRPEPKKAKVEDILDEAPKAKKQKKNR